MADRSVEHDGPTPEVERRVVNPTLVTPGPQPLEAGPPADEAPQVLRGEVIGPRHARPRPVDNRRKAAAGAILLSATGAATALFMFLGNDARDTSAAPGHDTSTAVPDEPESRAIPYAEAAVGDTPLRGARAEKPEPQPPAAAQPTSRAPAASSAAPDKPRTPPSSESRSAHAWPDRTSWGSGQYDDWQDAAEAFGRWAEQQVRRHADDGGSGPYWPGQDQGRGQWQGWGQGHGQPGHGGGYGGGPGYGGGNGYGGGYGGGYGYVGGQRR